LPKQGIGTNDPRSWPLVILLVIIWKNGNIKR
jgi:hypothetical protein